MQDVIVIGGSYAGMAAALQLLRARRRSWCWMRAKGATGLQAIPTDSSATTGWTLA